MAEKTSSFGDVPVRRVKTSTFGNPAVKQKSSYITDILRSVGTGLRRGFEGEIGAGGDIYNLGVAGQNKLIEGLPPEARAGIDRDVGLAQPEQSWFPTSQEVNKATSGYIGEEYEPQTEIGKWTATGAEYASNPAKGFFRNVIAPMIGTEVGGKVGEKFGYEGAGRLLGGLGGGTATGGSMRSLTGPQISKEKQRLAQLMADQGIELTGGQVSGNKALQYMETGPFETKPATMADTQGRQFNKAALKEAGIDWADEVTPEVLGRADANFGTRYENVVRTVGGIPLDGDLETALLQNVMDYERLSGAGAKPAVKEYFQRISDAAQQNNNTIPADIFKEISSQISTDLRKLRGNPQGNAELMDTLREFRTAMFDSVGRSGKADVVADWKKLNREYRNYKDIERAMYGPGEATAEGMISPAKLRTSVAAGDKAGALREKGDLSSLAKGGANLMTDLPQTGSGPRNFLNSSLMAAAGLGGAGHWKEAIAALLGGTVGPAALGAGLTSKPVRTALIRQATNPLPMLDPQTAMLSSFMASPPPERQR